MTLNVTVNTSKTPVELTITSDKRRRTVRGTVEVAGETANFSGEFPPLEPKISGDLTWTKRDDDGVVAVYTAV